MLILKIQKNYYKNILNIISQNTKYNDIFKNYLTKTNLNKKLT